MTSTERSSPGALGDAHRDKSNLFAGPGMHDHGILSVTLSGRAYINVGYSLNSVGLRGGQSLVLFPHDVQAREWYTLNGFLAHSVQATGRRVVVVFRPLLEEKELLERRPAY